MNVADIPELPDALESVLRALPDWVGQVVAWVAAMSVALAPFSVWISNKLKDMLNRAAESAEGDDDEYLRRLFAKPAYRTTAVLLRFISVDLPTSSELERAIAFQKEAADKARQAGN